MSSALSSRSHSATAVKVALALLGTWTTACGEGEVIPVGSMVDAGVEDPVDPGDPVDPLPPIPGCPPAPENVGPSEPAELRPSGPITVTEDNTVIENVDVTGDIEINASNVTVRNFRVTDDGYWGIFVRGGSNIIIEDGEIDGQNAMDDAVRGANYTARRLYIHNLGGDAFKADGNNVIECNHITAIGQGSGAHGDGVQMQVDGNIVIRQNNFDLTTGSLTACVFPSGIGPVRGPVYVQDNRMNGGAYIVYCSDQLHLTGNTFGPDYSFGPVTGSCREWVDNTWESDGTPVR